MLLLLLLLTLMYEGGNAAMYAVVDQRLPQVCEEQGATLKPSGEATLHPPPPPTCADAEAPGPGP